MFSDYESYALVRTSISTHNAGIGAVRFIAVIKSTKAKIPGDDYLQYGYVPAY